MPVSEGGLQLDISDASSSDDDYDGCESICMSMDIYPLHCVSQRSSAPPFHPKQRAELCALGPRSRRARPHDEWSLKEID